MEIQVPIVIVGRGLAGIVTVGCLNRLNISNIVLERNDCIASLWRKRAYDCLKLHLGKEFCNLPYMPFPSNLPNFVPRVEFLRFIDSYVAHFNIDIKCNRFVDFAFIDESSGKWRLIVKDTSCDANEVYVADFLVVATGENSEGFIPKVDGLERFERECMHCNKYMNGKEMYANDVLVVGCMWQF